MDLVQRPEGSEGVSPFPWKPVVIAVAIGQFAIETWINWRQLKVLRRWSVLSENEDRIWDIKRTRLRIWKSFLSMIQVVALIGLDAVPTLWGFVVEKQKKLLEGTNLPHLWISEEFDSSAIFMICCYIAFLLINLPTYFYRTVVMKEKVIRDFYGRKNRNRALRDIAKGRPVSAMLVFTGMFTLEFKIFGLKFDGNYILVVVALQLLFVILYPVLTQPKRKTLSVMGPGRTKDAIEELAVAAKFPLKGTYIIDDHERQCVQVFGLLRRKYIAIPKAMIEEGGLDEIVGLTAHAMGSWKFSNGFRVFCVGQMNFNVAWTYLSLFANERTNYEAFGFQNEYPRMAAIVIFTIAFAPFMAAVFGVNINNMGRKNDFIADKYAVELGHSSALTSALTKKQYGEGNKDIDTLFAIYYNSVPALSERLKALEKLREEKVANEEGLISLSGDEKK